jgi:hypothetical protein
MIAFGRGWAYGKGGNHCPIEMKQHVYTHAAQWPELISGRQCGWKISGHASWSGSLKISLAIFWCCFGGWLTAAPLAGEVDDYDVDTCDVVWDSPGTNAADSMPIGNGEVGLNVWTEPDGDLVFYVARTDAWSECCRLLKLGRVRVHISPNPFAAGRPFRQELKLRDGQVVIAAGDLELCVFVDAQAPVIYVTGRSATAYEVKASWETWRTEDHVLTGEELTSSWTMRDAPSGIKVWESADIVTNSGAAGIMAWHRNAYSIVPLTLKQQGLESLASLMPDPLADRTFGARMSGEGFVGEGEDSLKSAEPLKKFVLSIATETRQSRTIADWKSQMVKPVKAETARRRTAAWWNQFWNRSWISVQTAPLPAPPRRAQPLRVGVDSNGSSRFAGIINNATVAERVWSPEEVATLARTKPGQATPPLPATISVDTEYSMAAWIKPAAGEYGRVFDSITAGGSDGFLFDTYPGLSLRLIVGTETLTQPDCLKAGEWQHVAATVDARGAKRIYLNGRLILTEGGGRLVPASVTQAYALQRWVTACAGRGEYPIKFNGSLFTVDAKLAGGPDLNADWRRWGDCYWWQNTRFPYYPMMASGDFDEVRPLFREYEAVRSLSQARAKLYYGAEGVYFPETMNIFGTYANSDYGWIRGDHPAGEILNPWWRYAWQQGLELTDLMIDYYEYTGDKKFLQHELIPMANAVLRYYDTRFPRDANGQLVIRPTQVIETYRRDVVDDTPSVAGLTDVCDRLLKLPAAKSDREFWRRMRAATPPVTLKDGGVQPAKEFNPERSNVENPELYAIWPFRLYGVGHPDPEIAVKTFHDRLEKASIGWQYDGQCAALAGLGDEAARILLGKIGNSNANFRFPAMWGPNYDWLPDQDHGSNIMLTLQDMILQSAGGKLYVLPAWPKGWKVNFKLCAPENTIVEGSYDGTRLVTLKVTPASRRADVRVLTPE